jgi:hypothetical protein
MIDGIDQSEVDKEDLIRYRCAPVNIKSLKIDWLLDNVSDEDQ